MILGGLLGLMCLLYWSVLYFQKGSEAVTPYIGGKYYSLGLYVCNGRTTEILQLFRDKTLIHSLNIIAYPTLCCLCSGNQRERERWGQFHRWFLFIFS